MSEPLDKNEKDCKNLWWVIAEIIGSIAGVFFFIETLSGIFDVDNYGLRIAMTLLCFILVPMVFALPTIIKKLKLLFIPVIIMPLVIVLFYPYFPEPNIIKPQKPSRLTGVFRIHEYVYAR